MNDRDRIIFATVYHNYYTLATKEEHRITHDNSRDAFEAKQDWEAYYGKGTCYVTSTDKFDRMMNGTY